MVMVALILTLTFNEPIQLETVDHSGIVRFESNKNGHFLYDRESGVAFHFNVDGRLLYSTTPGEECFALYYFQGKYLVTWVDWEAGKYGVDVRLGEETLQSLSGVRSYWFFEIGGLLYGSPDSWGPYARLIVPIDAQLGKLSRSKHRKSFFRPIDDAPNMDMVKNYKRVWAVASGKSQYVMTPLDNRIFEFQDGVLMGTIQTDIPWNPFGKSFELSGFTDRLEWAKSFNRVVYFGSVMKEFIIGVEAGDGESTNVYWLDHAGRINKRRKIKGWGNKGLILGGSDSRNVYAFDAEKMLVIPLK